MKTGKKAVIACIVGLFLLLVIYFSGQLLWPVQLSVGVDREATRREHQLLYEVDQAALAAELRKLAYDYRWSTAFPSGEPTIFSPNDPAIPQSLKILQPTSMAIFDDRIMFERGGPLHHFGLVVFRDASVARTSHDDSVTGEKLLREFQPGVWFYSDHRKVSPR